MIVRWFVWMLTLSPASDSVQTVYPSLRPSLPVHCSLHRNVRTFIQVVQCSAIVEGGWISIGRCLGRRQEKYSVFLSQIPKQPRALSFFIIAPSWIVVWNIFLCNQLTTTFL